MECLKIALKEEVQDNMLPYLGELFFKMKNNTEGKQFYYTNTNTEGKLRIVGDGYFIVDGVHKKEINYGTAVYLSAGEYYLGLSDKYTLVAAIELQNVDTSELRYCGNILNGLALSSGCTGVLSDLSNQTSIRIYTPFITGEIDDLNLSSMVSLLIDESNTSIMVDLSKFAESTSLQRLNIYIGDNLTGSIASLNNLTNFVDLYARNNKTVTGDLKDLAEAQVSRTSGTLSIKNCSSVLINGNTVAFWRKDIVFGTEDIKILGYRTGSDSTLVGTYDRSVPGEDKWTWE